LAYNITINVSTTVYAILPDFNIKIYGTIDVITLSMAFLPKMIQSDNKPQMEIGVNFSESKVKYLV